MYVLRSKKTGIDCGWSPVLWKTGGFEIVDDGSGMDTPPKVIAGIQEATGLNLTSGTPQPAAPPSALDQPEPAGIVQPVVEEEPAEPTPPETFVTDAADPATVPTDLFSGAVAADAEDNS